MYCPCLCGTDSTPGVQYCRVCGRARLLWRSTPGANLKVIGKAVALSEAIARSDRGPLPKIREMVKNLKVGHVTEEVAGALERMNNETARISPEKKGSEHRPWISFRKQKTAAEPREQNISKGIVSLFSGTGLTVFLYYLSAALVLKLPPHIVAQIPFEIDPVVRIIWLLGLIPTLSGLGHIVAGLLIRPQRYQLQETEQRRMEHVEFPRSTVSKTPSIPSVPDSVTDHTTKLLQEPSVR